MKKFLNNIQEEASHIRMSAGEKAAMRAALFGAASPVEIKQSPYFFFSYQFRMALAGLMFFVVVGTASAAQGSLPGDLLYPVKININEPLKVALAPNAAAKAAVHADLADARIEEAQALAAQGKLDASTTATLAANFDEHAQNAETLADSAEEDDPAAAAQVKTKLASSLAVNGAVLQQIGEESSNADTKQQSDSFGARVIARAEGPARVAMAVRTFAAPTAAKHGPASGSGEGSGGMAPQATSLTVSGGADTAVEQDLGSGSQKVAALLQGKSADLLAQTKILFEDTKSTIDATSSAQLEQALTDADAHMSAGSTELDAGDYNGAQEDFTAVLRTSARLSALLVAQKKFDGGVLKSLIKIDLDR